MDIMNWSKSIFDNHIMTIIRKPNMFYHMNRAYISKCHNKTMKHQSSYQDDIITYLNKSTIKSRKNKFKNSYFYERTILSRNKMIEKDEEGEFHGNNCQK